MPDLREPAPSAAEPVGHRAKIALAVVFAVALALRMAGARGDLWFDEVWSIDLLRSIDGVGGIFWGINHDNNHFLNSLWLWSVGLDAAPWLQRAAAIAVGVAAVALAASLGRRHGPRGAILAGAALAVSYIEVHYASEARGYAGMLACFLGAIVLLERTLDERPSLPLALGLGVVLVVGMLWQMFMLPALLVLGLWAVEARARATRDLRRVSVYAVSTFWFGVVTVVGLMALLTVVRLRYGLTAGGLEPFSLADFAEGYGTAVGRALGLPTDWPPFAGLVAALAVLAATMVLARGRRDDRIGLYVAFIVFLPALMVALDMPNVFMARYYLAPVTVLLLAGADLVGLLWSRGRTARFVAVALACGFLVGNGMMLARFFADGRGHYGEAVALMAAEGPIVVGGDHDLRGSMLLAHYLRRAGLEGRWVAMPDLCRDRPKWMLVEDPKRGARRLRPFLAACPMTFTPVARTAQWGLSGTPWTIYRVGPATGAMAEELPSLR